MNRVEGLLLGYLQLHPQPKLSVIRELSFHLHVNRIALSHLQFSSLSMALNFHISARILPPNQGIFILLTSLLSLSGILYLVIFFTCFITCFFLS